MSQRGMTTLPPVMSLHHCPLEGAAVTSIQRKQTEPSVRGVYILLTQEIYTSITVIKLKRVKKCTSDESHAWRRPSRQTRISVIICHSGNQITSVWRYWLKPNWRLRIFKHAFSYLHIFTWKEQKHTPDLFPNILEAPQFPLILGGTSWTKGRLFASHHPCK